MRLSTLFLILSIGFGVVAATFGFFAGRFKWRAHLVKIGPDASAPEKASALLSMETRGSRFTYIAASIGLFAVVPSSILWRVLDNASRGAWGVGRETSEKTVTPQVPDRSRHLTPEQSADLTVRMTPFAGTTVQLIKAPDRESDWIGDDISCALSNAGLKLDVLMGWVSLMPGFAVVEHEPSESGFKSAQALVDGLKQNGINTGLPTPGFEPMAGDLKRPPVSRLAIMHCPLFRPQPINSPAIRITIGSLR